MKHLLLAAAAASLALPVTAQEPAPVPSPGEIAAAAPASDWIAIAPSDLLVMDLAPDAKGKGRRVVIQLMPPPFSQGWIGNIRKLAAAHWWDGTSVNRVQDNYVVQWGDATEKKALPEGLAVVPESDYQVEPTDEMDADLIGALGADAPQELPLNGNFSRTELTSDAGAGRTTTVYETSVVGADTYARESSNWKGWPVATDLKEVWPIHCYGAVGVGRNLSPDTGTGAELYTVIGHAPRHLDRNIAVVGRVIAGIEHLSSLPRGTGALGFYEDEAERVPIASIRLANTLPAADQPRFEYLSTESESFHSYADARANRRDPFFIKPAGGADICNIPVPVRLVGAGSK